MKIEVFGSGCCKCNDLYDLVQQAVGESQTAAEIVKVSDMTEIVKRGIMRTPALAVDGRVVCAGRAPKYDEVLAWVTGGK